MAKMFPTRSVHPVLAILLVFLAPHFSHAGGFLQPATHYGGYAADQITIVADDFQLTRDSFINEIVWWGDLAPTSKFYVQLYDDNGNRPGNSLGPLQGHITSQATGRYVNEDRSGNLYPEYRYSFWLSNPTFVKGRTRYWFSVGNTDAPSGWLWEASKPGFNQRSWDGRNWEPYLDDMAFEINPQMPKTYQCLFYQADSTGQTHSGSLSFTLAESRALSGALFMDNLRHSLRGQLDSDLTATVDIPRSKKSPLQITLHMLVDKQPIQFAGKVSSDSWTAELQSAAAYYDSQGFPSEAGQYALTFGGSTQGYLSLSSTGNVSLKGKLPDGTPFVYGAKRAHGGAFPVYIKLPGGKGSLSGWFSSDGTSKFIGNLILISSQNSGNLTAICYRVGAK